MLKWIRGQASSQSSHGAASDRFLSSSSSHAASTEAASRVDVMEALPSEQDRLIMLRAVLVATDMLQTKKYGDEQRLCKVLQEDFVRHSCTALHLISNEGNEDDDNEEQQQKLCFVMANAASLDPSLVIDQPYECITLLVSNIVLLYGSKGGYDARVRHSLKTACVHVLYTSVASSLEHNVRQNAMDEFDVSVGGIYCASTGQAGRGHVDEKEGSITDQSNDGDGTAVEERGRDSNGVMQALTNATPETYADNALTERQGRIHYIVTRKFELVERAIATRIFRVLVEENNTMTVTDGERTTLQTSGENNRVRRRHVVRGLQITSVGVVAGTLFAVTGGLAGPAIAAAIAGLGVVSSTSAAAAIAMLTTVKAAAALFGVGGGGLAAYKMKKRTQGLTEFHIRRENIEQNMYEGASDESIRRGVEASLPQLHTTICVSGWLKDKCDYQRAWGIQPTDPPIQDKMELLMRFFTVHDPELVGSCNEVIKQRRKRERSAFSWDVVWSEIEMQYGRSPDHLLPLARKDTNEVALTFVEQRSIHDVLRKVVLTDRDPTLAEQMMDETGITKEPSSGSCETSTVDTQENASWKWFWFASEEQKTSGNDGDDNDSVSSTDNSTDSSFKSTASSGRSNVTAVDESLGGTSDKADGQQSHSSETDLVVGRKPSKEEEDALIVWDWQALYGGDMHTITWESKVLLDLCHVVSSMATEVTSQATKYALQFSVIGAIVAAVAVPSALLTASQLIDDPYQIVILRADEAGVELAKCLLQSEERRPVTLVGYSFGARVIYSCLIELARHQKLWEKKQGLAQDSVQEQSSLFLFRQEEDESNSMEYAREPASIVEDVVFMGLPRIIDRRAFATCRQIAGGRIVNCYTKNDWFLSLMFIARAGTQTAGTSPIENVDGIENYNVTDLVSAHANYPDSIAPILQRINFGHPNALSR